MARPPHDLPGFHKADVDLAGLMKVLGEHLYSTPLVAVRELIQNAHDAIARRRAEDATAFVPRIDVAVDVARKVITIADNGAGLTDDEIRRYLATVGAGYTRQLRAQAGPVADELIGMFGLGFLSAFVVADKTTVTTCSYQTPAQPWSYSSRSGETYTLAAATPAQAAGLGVGTHVELVLKPAHWSLADEAVLGAVLSKYAALLGVPVYLAGSPTPINDLVPPWRDPPPGEAAPADLALRKARLAFVAPFEPTFEPLCTLPIEKNDAGVAGLLWIQDGSSYGNADNRNLHVYVRGMMLDDAARDLLPRWAGFVGGVIESSRLVPTASREALQRDATWDAAAGAIRLALVSELRKLAANEPQTWRRVCLFHNEALLGAALADDELFELLRDQLTVPTTEGDLPVKSIFARAGNRAFVSLAVRGGFEETLFRAQKIPVVAGRRYAAAAFCERHAQAAGGTVVRLGTKEGLAAVFRRADGPAGWREVLQAVLGDDASDVVLAKFEPADIPLVTVVDRDAELKAAIEGDEADKRMGAGVLALARRFTAGIKTTHASLYVNVSSPAIARLMQAHAAGSDVASLRRHPAAALLRGLATLTSGSGEASGGGGEAFLLAYRAVASAVDGLLMIDTSN